MSAYKLGNTVKVSAVFRDVDGDLTDPNTVTARKKVPAGTETSYVYGVDAALVRNSIGSYYLLIPTTTAGTYYYRFVGDDDMDTANEGSFTVNMSAFTTP